MKEEKKSDANAETAALKTVDTSHASPPQTPVDQGAPLLSSIPTHADQQQNQAVLAAAFEEDDKIAVMKGKLFKQQA